MTVLTSSLPIVTEKEIMSYLVGKEIMSLSKTFDVIHL
jgi:hypothetical protein